VSVGAGCEVGFSSIVSKISWLELDSICLLLKALVLRGRGCDSWDMKPSGRNLHPGGGLRDGKSTIEIWSDNYGNGHTG
jgi:hypothetical protein